MRKYDLDERRSLVEKITGYKVVIENLEIHRKAGKIKGCISQ